MPKRMIWELALLSAGLFYVVVVLLDYPSSPVFAAIFVCLSVQELVRSHWKKDHGNGTSRPSVGEKRHARHFDY